MVPKLVAELLKRGWKDEEVKLALGQNLIRVLTEAEAVRRGDTHTHITASSKQSHHTAVTVWLCKLAHTRSCYLPD